MNTDIYQVEKDLEEIKNSITAFLDASFDEWQCQLDDEIDEIQATISTDTEAKTWAYQTGDNSYSGSCYGHPAWGVSYICEDTEKDDFISDILDELDESFWQNYDATEKTSHDDMMEEIHNSYINGQKSQMVTQIESYGTREFVLDFKEYCDGLDMSETWGKIVYTFFYLKQ